MGQPDAAFQLGNDLGQASWGPQSCGSAPRKAHAEVSFAGPADRRPPALADHDSTVTQGPWSDAGTAHEAAPDHFICRDGVEYAGEHLIIDLWQAARLDDIAHIEQTMIAAVEAAGATLLHIHLHHFTPNGGVSGVAVLAESHISIHTWPERDFAALDVFMCGDAAPERTVPVLARAFAAGRVEVGQHRRGVVVVEAERREAAE